MSTTNMLAALGQSFTDSRRALTGEVPPVDSFYFPPELIGGSCPLVRGEGEQIAWNAAAEALDTERIHFFFHTVAERVWYLAIRSADLASHPNTWCPFAAVLPGQDKANPPPVIYTHYTEDAGVMMTVTSDGLQIHRGTASVIKAKAERTARDLGEAPVVDLVPDVILTMTPVPWQSLSLQEDRARRILTTLAVLVGLGLGILSFVLWLLSSMALLAHRVELADTIAQSKQASLQLLQDAEQLSASPLQQQLAEFIRINEGLVQMGGWLQQYRLNGEERVWRALLPPNITADRITELGGRSLEATETAILVGDGKEIKE